ncbi:uncharacterized protein LOC120352455 [Nilaparvata lugens]|uniref:uncharacterized protein LOC120352455 n=1 Tax=Nilaparvata lugens TaxID=108931 RepID=UPI00193E1477|nr:uncharacterized protein LOC120352455 [Nilaparvata lugens]
MSFGDSNNSRFTRNDVVLCVRCRRCVTDDSDHNAADRELIAMFESDESSSDDADGNYDYSFPSDKVKCKRMDEKRAKREAKPRNKNFAIWLQTSTKFHSISSLKFVFDRTEEYKYKKDLIDDDDYLFLLSILPTLLNLTPYTRFKICRGINSVLVEEINKILVEGFKNTYWRRGDKYNSKFFKETQYSIPLAKRSQYSREAQLLMLVSDNLEYFQSYRDEEYSLPGLDIDEVFIYLMCNLPIIKMYDSSQKLVIRRAINENLIQGINDELSNQVGIRDCNPIQSENTSSQLLLQSMPSVSEADDKMELRLYINKAVKIIDHDRLKPNELLHSDQTYLFLMRVLHIVKYLKLTPKLSLFNRINGLLLIAENCNDLGDLPKPENVPSQSESSLTDQVPELADNAIARDNVSGNYNVSGKNDDDEELDEHLSLIEEKLQAIENRIRANEFNMELRKDGDYLFLISIYSIIKKLSQPRQIQLFNGILKFLNDVSSSRDCLFSV